MQEQDLIERQKKALNLAREGQLEAALDTINQAVRDYKSSSLSYFIKGRIHDELLEYEASVASYKKCLSRDKNNKKAKFYLGLALLTLEQFDEGCRYYEARHDIETLKKFGAIKKWFPKSSRGKVLIWAEQGIGDEIMFLQLIRHLEELHHEFYLECDKRLHGVLETNYPWLNVVSRGTNIIPTEFEYQFPMGDLLLHFHKKIPEIFPLTLKANDVSEVNLSLEKYIKRGVSLVGMSWLSMNAEYGLRRSRPVDSLCKHLNPENTAIVNLQYLVPNEDIEKLRSLGFDVIDQFDCYNDINSVFALISKCNKIITIDNSVAHFAGALGIETELWLPALQNWRWGLESDKSYWYPNLSIKHF